MWRVYLCVEGVSLRGGWILVRRVYPCAERVSLCGVCISLFRVCIFVPS